MITMKRVWRYLFYGVIFLIVVALAYSSFNTSKGKKTETGDGQKNKALANATQTEKSADKVQVFLFHNTQRCYSCVTIGKFAKATVEQKFPEQVKTGKIEFKEINIDLPENKDLAAKFQAAGSALYINPIIDGKDNIQQDTQVWRLVSNEQAFISYLSDKIQELL